MLTSVVKFVASSLRLVADTLDPKPHSFKASDLTIHIKDPGTVSETLEKIKRMEMPSVQQAMRAGMRF